MDEKDALLYRVLWWLVGWRFGTKRSSDVKDDLWKRVGIVVGFVSLYLLTFKERFENYGLQYRLPVSWEFWVMVVLLYSGAVLLYWWVRRRSLEVGKKILWEEQMAIFYWLLVPVVLWFLCGLGIGEITYLFLVNFLYLGWLLLFIAIGYRRYSLYIRVISFVFMVLWVLARYTEVEGSWLYKSLLFLVMGAVLLGAGLLLEKNKEKFRVPDV